MEKFEIARDNGAALAFTGDLIAKVPSSDNNASGSSYSGQAGRWQVLALYCTKGGKLICERIDRIRWQGERDGYPRSLISRTQKFGLSAVLDSKSCRD